MLEGSKAVKHESQAWYIVKRLFFERGILEVTGRGLQMVLVGKGGGLLGCPFVVQAFWMDKLLFNLLGRIFVSCNVLKFLVFVCYVTLWQ